MSKQKFNTAVGFYEDRPQGLLLDALEKREQCPEAFLFNEKEARSIYKAREAIIDIAAKYSQISEEDRTEELEAQMLADYIEAFERRRVPVKKLQRLFNRAKKAKYWTAVIVKIRGAFSADIKARTEDYKITTNTPEEYPEKVLTLDNCPAFFTAQNTAERRKAAGLPESYLYANQIELNVITVIGLIYSVAEAPEEEQPEGFNRLISSQELNAFNNIGAAARKPKKTRKPNEQGRNISIFEYADINGIDLALHDVKATENALLTVGNPNTDKLLKQAQIIASKNRTDNIKITKNDFMEFRGLTDAKSALEQMDQAAEAFERTGYRYNSESADKSKDRAFIPYFKFIRFKCEQGEEGYIHLVFNDPVYNQIRVMSEKGQQIMLSDKRIMYLPSNQGTAYNIANKMEEHTRTNAGGKNDHVLSVKALLNCCCLLPLYPESKEEQGAENYLRYPSEAPARIIKPFIKALEFITIGTQKNVKYQILKSYKFEKPRGGSITPKELEAAQKDYKKFIELNIRYQFDNEPDYSHLIESKQKKQDK